MSTELCPRRAVIASAGTIYRTPKFSNNKYLRFKHSIGGHDMMYDKEVKLFKKEM